MPQTERRRFLSFIRFLRTIRYLRARQLAYQILYRLPRKHHGRDGDSGPMPGLRWAQDVNFPAPAGDTANERNVTLSGSLTFLNRRETVGFPPKWNRTDLPRLWLYNLHYHEFLWELEFEQARAVVLDWVANHGPGGAQVGWEAYPTSLRLANWCAIFFGRYRSRTLTDEPFCEKLWASIYEQAEHLRRNLEWHVLGNHLLENAVALALVGSCFEHQAARVWFGKGCAILTRELPEQILADGGHVERSPMYQCRVLYTLLFLNATGDSFLNDLVRPYLGRLAGSLAAVTHPDGGIALLNDSAFGIYPRPRELMERAGVESSRVGVFALAESGYYGARTGDGNYILCDAGAIGPDYQPGHGHADLFSFELSLQGTRVVVDSGVSTYETGPMRDYCRSTRAHNTVEIEGEDQVELWAAFRVGRRCRPREVEWKAREDGFELSGRHDGYRRLPGRPTHARTFRWYQQGRLEIHDRVDADRPLRSVARLHFHPDCRIDDVDGDACVIFFPRGRVRISWSGWAVVANDASFYCPEFGIALPNPCLAFSGAVGGFEGTIRIERL